MASLETFRSTLSPLAKCSTLSLPNTISQTRTRSCASTSAHPRSLVLLPPRRREESLIGARASPQSGCRSISLRARAGGSPLPSAVNSHSVAGLGLRDGSLFVSLRDSCLLAGHKNLSISRLGQSANRSRLLLAPAPSDHVPSFRPLASSANNPDSVKEKEEGDAASPPSPSTTSSPSPAAASSPASNGATSSSSEGEKQDGSSGPLPLGDPEYTPLQGWGKFSARVKMFFAPPWARFKKGSVLSIRLAGRINEQLVGFAGGSVIALPRLLENLEKAAVDPRVSALYVRIDALSAGWGKIDEVRRYVRLFRQSGKSTIAYMQVVGESEYYLASAFEEIYVPPSAYVSLRGLAVQGAFLGGVLEKAGIEPQVKRIGKYKSAGDQFARKDMSEAQKEMLGALLDDIYFNWISAIAAARGKTVDEVQELLDSGILKADQLLENGLVNGLLYESEIESMLKEKLGQTKPDKPLLKVEYRKYSRVGRGTFNLGGSKDAMVAVLRANGAISQGRDRGGAGGGVRSDSFIEKIRFVREAKQFKAVVLRIDSPGGDALASDLMWHELRELAKVKPLVASMSDVAASGGYYMAMAAPTIVAEHLTLTGSIGVVLAKFNLGNLYGRIGFNREILSKGKFAQLNADNRPFSPEEEKFFEAGAESAYESFRNKAALSRSMEVEAMEAVAQGRVWTGNQALQRGLVDALGGVSRAIAIAKEKAGIPADKRVRTVELSVAMPSFTALLSGAQMLAQVAGLHGEAAQQAAFAQIVFRSAGTEADVLLNSPPGTPNAIMPDIHITGLSQLSRSAPLGGLQPLLGSTKGAQALPLVGGLVMEGLAEENGE